MIETVSLALISLWGVLATIVVVERDGYRAVPTDRLLLP